MYIQTSIYRHSFYEFPFPGTKISRVFSFSLMSTFSFLWTNGFVMGSDCKEVIRLIYMHSHSRGFRFMGFLFTDIALGERIMPVKRGCKSILKKLRTP